MGEFAIGQGVPRFEDPRLVRGEGRYVADIVLPGHRIKNALILNKLSEINTCKYLLVMYLLPLTYGC